MQHLNQLKHLAPEQLEAFSGFNESVFTEGALSKKEKEIIAVAIAHVIESPNSIDTHSRNARAEGASLEELVEAVFVVAGVEAGGAVTHSTHISNAIDPEASDALYNRSNLKKLGFLRRNSPDGFKAYSNFSGIAVKAGKLSSKFKEIIAVAVAHATQCPYCIDVHTKNAINQGATNEELSEGVMITSALLARGAFSHMNYLLQCYEE